MGNILEQLKSILLKIMIILSPNAKYGFVSVLFPFIVLKVRFPKNFTCASSAYSVRQSGTEREERTAPLL